MTSSGIASNLARVRERIARAAEVAGRDAASVRLMGVSKTMPAVAIRAAHAAGLRLFGENRVQEFEEKRQGLEGLEGAEFRLVGHLQSNKAQKAAALFDAVESLDSLALAAKLDAACGKARKRLPVLIEINIGNEESKSGLTEGSEELEALLTAAPRFSHLELRGLMAVPPFPEKAEDSRPFFQRMRRLRDALAARRLPGVGMEELSMGMSSDFEIAIEEGSTCVRVGTAIFGARTPWRKP